jgi:ABC-type transport system involved in multi-copper enzyme maturation permease subunit
MSVALFGGFQVLICALVTAIDLDAILEQVMAAAPPFFGSLIGQQFAGLSVAGLVAFGWNHPVAHAVGAAVAIILGARVVAGEIEQGAAELLWSQPLSRGRYFAAHGIFGCAALALVAAAGVGGTLLGMYLNDIPPFAARTLAGAGLNFWLLNVAWFAIALAASARGRESGPVATLVFFIALVSYLVVTIGGVWEPAAPLLPFGLQSYYAPRDILVAGTLRASSLAVLAGVAALGMLAGWVAFSRRDVP